MNRGNQFIFSLIHSHSHSFFLLQVSSQLFSQRSLWFFLLLPYSSVFKVNYCIKRKNN